VVHEKLCATRSVQRAALCACVLSMRSIPCGLDFCKGLVGGRLGVSPRAALRVMLYRVNSLNDQRCLKKFELEMRSD